jgi:hypothetical protein
MIDAARSRLASMEAEFVRALSTGGPYPSGSDLRGMNATSRLLRAKRVRTMRKAWPELAGFLGDSLPERALELLAGIPLPPGDHAVEDGLLVARRLEAAGPIPDSLRLKMLGVTLRYRRHRSHLLWRMGPAVGWTYLHQSGRVVCALRLPGLRLFTLQFPCPLGENRVGAYSR